MLGKGVNELPQCALGVVVLIELIGIREQVALQTGNVLGFIVDEAVVIRGRFRGL